MRAALLAAGLVLASLLAGCASQTPPLMPPELPGATVTATADGWQYAWTSWPGGAELVEVTVTCACPGQSALVTGNLSALWRGDPGGQLGPGPSANRDRAGADLFSWAILQDRSEPLASPRASLDVWRQYALGIGLSYPSSVVVDAGVGPPQEQTFGQFGAGGDVTVSFSQPTPYELLLGGPTFRLSFLATNQTGARERPSLDLKLMVPQGATVGVGTAAGVVRLAADEPLLGDGRGQAVDVAWPARLAVREFGASSMAVDAEGPLYFVVAPWARSPGTATYRIEAPDHAYTVDFTKDANGSLATCTDGCDGLGGSYTPGAGFAPPGTTTFRIQQARCQGDEGCNGVLVAADLHADQATSW